jgi:hypothetical protein
VLNNVLLKNPPKIPQLTTTIFANIILFIVSAHHTRVLFAALHMKAWSEMMMMINAD